SKSFRSSVGTVKQRLSDLILKGSLPLRNMGLFGHNILRIGTMRRYSIRKPGQFSMTWINQLDAVWPPGSVRDGSPTATIDKKSWSGPRSLGESDSNGAAGMPPAALW